MGTELTSPERRWERLLLLMIVVHCVVGLARLPRVTSKRLGEVASYRDHGGVRWRLETAFPDQPDVIEQSIRTIDELLSSTPPEAIVLFRGRPEDALEYAPALLWPRLCCFEALVPPGTTTHRGRPIADRVLVGEGAALTLEPR